MYFSRTVKVMFVRPGSNDPTTAYSCSTDRFACWRADTELNGLEGRWLGLVGYYA